MRFQRPVMLADRPNMNMMYSVDPIQLFECQNDPIKLQLVGNRAHQEPDCPRHQGHPLPDDITGDDQGDDQIRDVEIV